MRFFVKAIASGFAVSLGTALFKKVSSKLGLDDSTVDETKKGATKKQGATQSSSSSEEEDTDTELL